MAIFMSAQCTRLTSGDEGNRWQDNSDNEYYSFMSPFGSVLLQKRTAYPATFAYCDGSRLYIGYGNNESVGSILTSPAEAISPVHYSDEFLYIEFDCARGHITMQRDAFCTLPLFIAAESDEFICSNSFEYISSQIDSSRLYISKSRLADYIIDQETERQDTYIENITTLGERERLVWNNGESSRLHLASAGEGSVTFDADPYQFRQFLDTLLADYAQKYIGSTPVGAEFSGGIDSSIVAGYLADHGHDPLLVTLGFPGEHQVTQGRKLSDFKARFGTRQVKVELDSERLFPLSRMALGGQWQPFYEREEIYREGFSTCAKLLADEGVQTVFNGIGGDDTLARYDTAFGGYAPATFFDSKFLKDIHAQQQERTWDRVAPPLVPRQVLMARISHNNAYLELGIWPVSPLADPRLVAYCQNLGLRYRDNKNIYRLYCQAWGYPETVYQPNTNEDFGFFFLQCAKRHFGAFADRWLERSALVEAGAIDKDATLHYIKNVQTIDEAYIAYKIITIESNLQLLNMTLARSVSAAP